MKFQTFLLTDSGEFDESLISDEDWELIINGILWWVFWTFSVLLMFLTGRWLKHWGNRNQIIHMVAGVLLWVVSFTGYMRNLLNDDFDSSTTNAILAIPLFIFTNQVTANGLTTLAFLYWTNWTWVNDLLRFFHRWLAVLVFLYSQFAMCSGMWIFTGRQEALEKYRFLVAVTAVPPLAIFIVMETWYQLFIRKEAPYQSLE